MQALLLHFRQHGKKAIEKVAREQPAAYLKILALLVPREMKLEHSGGVKAMSDEQIEEAIEAIQTMLAARAGEAAKVIEGAPGSRRPFPRKAIVQAQAEPDDRGRHCDRAAGAHSAQDATASGRVISTIWSVVFFEREDLPCGATPSSVSPKILESVGRHFGVSDGVLNVLVA